MYGDGCNSMFTGRALARRGAHPSVVVAVVLPWFSRAANTLPTELTPVSYPTLSNPRTASVRGWQSR